MQEPNNLDSAKAALKKRGYAVEYNNRMPGFEEWVSPDIADGSPLIPAFHSVLLEVPTPAQLLAQNLRRTGHSLKSIAASLNANGYRSESGYPYYPGSVKRLLAATRIMFLRDEGTAEHALPLPPRLIQTLLGQ